MKKSQLCGRSLRRFTVLLQNICSSHESRVLEYPFLKHAQRIKRLVLIGRCHLRRFLGRRFTGAFLSAGGRDSKLKRNATGWLRPIAMRASFLNDGEFLPRSMRLKKSTDIPIISANPSWVFPDSSRICRRRRPNCSRRVFNWTCTSCKSGVISLRVPPNGITG